MAEVALTLSPVFYKQKLKTLTRNSIINRLEQGIIEASLKEEKKKNEREWQSKDYSVVVNVEKNSNRNRIQ